MRPGRLSERRPVLVAVVLILAVGLGMHVRREYYRRLALRHRGYMMAELNRPSESLKRQWRRPGPGELDRMEWVEHQRAMTREYERIANYPWLPFRTPVAWGMGPR